MSGSVGSFSPKEFEGFVKVIVFFRGQKGWGSPKQLTTPVALLDRYLEIAT
jgi:hypothetical protein